MPEYNERGKWSRGRFGLKELYGREKWAWFDAVVHRKRRNEAVADVGWSRVDALVLVLGDGLVGNGKWRVPLRWKGKSPCPFLFFLLN